MPTASSPGPLKRDRPLRSAIGNRKSAPNREPSKRRPQVEALLLKGRTFRQIAASLGIAYGTVLWWAQQIYARHGVRSLAELLARLGKPAPVTKKEQVRRRVADGQTVARIARGMNLSPMCVYNHVYMLRRAGALPRKRGSPAAPAAARC